MEADELLTPVSAEGPCGPDLEYDRDFLALGQAAQGKPEQQFGDTLVPAEDPEWADVRQRAITLFPRTKDLRVAILLTRALTRTEGLPGLSSGLSLIATMLENLWDHLHPALDPDDGMDPTMRLNALAPLADSNSLLSDIRAVIFTGAAQNVRMSLRDMLISMGKLPAGSDPVPSQSEVEDILRAPKNAPAINAAREAIDSANKIRALLTEKCGAASGPDLGELIGMLKPVVQAATIDAKALAAEEGQEAAATGGTAFAIGGTDIRSREDVVRLLERICVYIERTEPSNPAPLLIRRAQRLLTKNFFEIIDDLVPDSLSQIRHIAGIRDD